MNGLKVGKGEVYANDIAYLKKYRDDYFKIVLFRTIRRAGYEAEDEEADHMKGKKNTVGNESKLAASLSRTRSAIFELALCNEWELFVTLTLNPEYYDRKDLHTYKTKLSTWIKNYNRLHNINIKNLLIPELHQDGISYHMHGLMAGLSIERLCEFTKEEKLPLKMIIEIARGHKLYNWPAYAKTFGYVSISEIESLEGVSKYITKYITKELYSTRISPNDHLYYCSQGLKRAEIIYRGQLVKELDEEYSNEYVKIKTVKGKAEARAYFIAEETSEAPKEGKGVTNSKAPGETEAEVPESGPKE